MRTITRLLAVLAFVGWTGAANAALIGYNFSYELTPDSTHPGLVITGMLVGELQGDGNTVLVDSVSDVALGGLPFNPLFNDPTHSIVTIDGQTMDFCPATDPCSTEGFIMQSSAEIGGVEGFHNSYGGFGDNWDAANWTLTPKVVPIPAAAWLFGSALLGLGVIKRRKA